ncbi:MAG: ChbG/HpnK family deacetylase [Myxococcaceae bacterium]|nr:ChbG/HpnK family deacetylase [Myxococcaceae bacterium]
MRLVFNADDLGLHPRIDEGIFRAREEGLLTSATVLVTGRTARQAIERASALGLGLGVHLCLTSRLSPAARARDVRWLAPGGRFRRDWAELSLAWLSGLIPRDEVVAEFEAQLERARRQGARVDHLDTHQHLHLLPGLASLVEGLAAREGLPVRWPRERPQLRWVARPSRAAKAALLSGLARLRPTPRAKRVRAWGVFESGQLTTARLVRLLETLPEGDHELVTHPGLAPGVVPEDPSWRYDWEAELEALTSPAVRDAVTRRRAELVTYAQLG